MVLQGITVVVLKGNDACYVSPMNKTNMEDPEMLEKYLKSHPVS